MKNINNIANDILNTNEKIAAKDPIDEIAKLNKMNDHS